MPTIAHVTDALEQIAPLRLAADWDSVGLLVGSRRPQIARVMTCLSLTPDVAGEAVREQADMVVAHHPLPFRPVPRITDDTSTGRVLLDLLRAGIAVWSSHTAWDSAAGGVNDQLATLLGLDRVAPIEPPTHSIRSPASAGRAQLPPAGRSPNCPGTSPAGWARRACNSWVTAVARPAAWASCAAAAANRWRR